MKQISFAVFAALLLGACSTGIPLEKYAPQGQARQDFTFCHGYSCTYKEHIAFTDAEWAGIAKTFKTNPAKTAGDERSKIGKAVAQMETLSGKKTGTWRDKAEAAAIKENIYQMDCLDETVNTSRYISFLAKDGLLKFHQEALPVHRGYIVFGGWPHNTATIREIKTGQQFVVDTFYRDNGKEPYIMPANVWLAGWNPHQK